MMYYDYVKYRRESCMPRSISWDITNKCNLKCKHCFNNSGDEHAHDFSKEIDKSTALDLAHQIVDMKVNQICLCGGETFLCDYLFDILDIFKQSEMLTSIVSNGYFITKDIAKKLQNLGVYQIQISIDGLGYQHDIFRGKKGAFDKAVAAVDELNKANIKTLVSCCPNKYNYNSFREYVNFIYDLGCKNIRMMPLLPIGRAQKYLNEIKLTDIQLFDLTNIISELNSEYENLQIEWGDPLEHLHTILLTRRESPMVMSIKSNGDIGITPYIDIVVANIANRRLKEIWNSGYNHIWENQEVIEIIKDVKCIQDLSSKNDTYKVNL